jgi:hypothetical protein
VPSSLIFAALAAAWLVVLVPMVAKRRQEVVRTTEAVLASRVLRRPATSRAAFPYGQEVPPMGERIAERELDPGGRRYRPGRGGFDPEAAALAARARYRFRQRVVLGLLLGALLALLLAFMASGQFWWVHGTLDIALIGYLGYLRRQVRIEEEVRHRRAARMAGSRSRVMPPAGAATAPEEADGGQPRHDRHHEPAPEAEQPPPRRAEPPRPAHPTAVALDLDDDDPMFDELNPAFKPSYRRAVGE